MKNIVDLENRLYNSAEVCKILGVSLRTLYRYIESGKINFETQSKTRRYFFSKKDLLGFLYPRRFSEKAKLHSPSQTPDGGFFPKHERRIGG